ncbi:hypothetical protein M3J09_008785 [Ascochyta lentis]
MPFLAASARCRVQVVDQCAGVATTAVRPCRNDRCAAEGGLRKNRQVA